MHIRYKTLVVGIVSGLFASISASSFAQIASYSNALSLSDSSGIGEFYGNYGGGPSYTNTLNTSFGPLSDSGSVSTSFASASVAVQESANLVASSPSFLEVSGSFSQTSDCSAIPQPPYTTSSSSGNSAQETLTFTITAPEYVTLNIDSNPGVAWSGYGSAVERLAFFSYNSYYGNWNPATLYPPTLNGDETYSAYLYAGTYNMGLFVGASTLAGTDHSGDPYAPATNLNLSVNYSLQVGTPAAVPEPASFLPLALGVLGIVARRRTVRRTATRTS